MTADGRSAALRRAVVALEPIDVREAASRDEVLAALDGLARPFDVDAQRAHVTASALVLGRRGIVLLRHLRLGIWLQPGGHVDAGEEPAEGAVREVLEETGLACAHPADGPLLLHVDAHDARGHRHLDLRSVLLTGDDDPAPPPDESPDCRWFAPAEAEAVADLGLAGALVKLRALAPGALVRLDAAAPWRTDTSAPR